MKPTFRKLIPHYLLLCLVLFFVLLPLWGMLSKAFENPDPGSFGALANFKRAWTVGKFGLFFKNSLIVALIVTAISVLLSILSGYAFGKLSVSGKSLLLPLILLGYMVPFDAAIIPLYNWMRSLGLTDTLWALILPQIGLSVSFGTLWMSSYFESLPDELVDQATIDGCSRWQVLWKVLMPIARPASSTLIVLIFMWTWNEFLLALVMIQKESLRTLPVGLAFFQGRYSANIPLMAAGTIIVALPTLLLYIFFQKQFLQGLSSGAIKG